MRTRKAAWLLAASGIVMLMGCADAIDNAMGISGDPSWNIPLKIEGNWRGPVAPNIRNLVSCLRVDHLTHELMPMVSLSVQGEVTSGQIGFADGQPLLSLSGKASAGAAHTGRNHAVLGIYHNGKRTGGGTFQPHGASGQLDASLWYKRPDTGGVCAMKGVLSRNSD